MDSYTVTFEFSIENAAGPADAAREAWAMVTDASYAPEPIATVTNLRTGETQDVDLDQEQREQEEV